MKLNKRNIDALPVPAAGYHLFWDESMPGFGVRITSSGYRSFVFERRISGKKKRLTIGRYGDITPEYARRKAISLAGDIVDGLDPVEEKRRRRVEMLTLRELMEDYILGRELKPLSILDMRKTMNNKLADWLDKPVNTISRDMVIERYRIIGSTTKSRANATMRYLRALLNYAAARYRAADGKSILEDNPVDVLSETRSWYRTERRATVIKPYQLRSWLKAVHALKDDAVNKERTTASDYLMLVLLTGLRRSEAERLRWEHVDLDDQTIKVVDTKNHKDHILPLSDWLFDMLRHRKKEAVNEYVFAARGGDGHICEPRKAMVKVMDESGIGFCLHDLRRTFATIADSLDIPGYAVKALLNHKDVNDVTAGYIIINVDRLREPMQKITDFVIAQVKP